MSVSTKATEFDSTGRPKSDNPSGRAVRISTDIDGCLANFAQGLCDYLNSQDNGNRSWLNWGSWEPWSCTPALMTKQQFLDGFKAVLNIPEWWASLAIYSQDDINLLNEQAGDGLYSLYCVTHRANLTADTGVKDASMLTKKWLAKNGLVNQTALIAGHNNRAELLKMLEIDFHIDDYGQEFLNLRKAGIAAYLLDRPWNRDIDTEYRVYSYDEFLAKTVFNREVVLRAL